MQGGLGEQSQAPLVPLARLCRRAVPGSSCYRRIEHDPDRHRSERSGSSPGGVRTHLLPPRLCRVPPAAAGRQGRLPLANRAIEHDPGHHRLECPGSSLSGNRFPAPLLVTLMGRSVGFSPPTEHPEALIYGRGMRVQVRQQCVQAQPALPGGARALRANRETSGAARLQRCP